MAYSTDDGRTATKYGDNPVIPANGDAFRDPNVFWYDPDNDWRMVVGRVAAEPEDDRPQGIEIYSSPDLTNWTYETAGDAYETPDLYELPVEGTDQTRWVLSVSVGFDRVEYHIGNFDGTTFTADKVVTADHGHDYYAPMTWNNEPNGRRVQLAWMNNWDYATDLPDNGWQGAQIFPRRVRLVDTSSEVAVRQTPASEIESIRQSKLADLGSGTISSSNDPLDGEGVAGRRLDIDTTVDPGDADVVGLRVREDGDGQETVVEFDAVNSTLTVDRTNSGAYFGSTNYDISSTDLTTRSDGTIQFRVLVDRSSVEVYVNDGEKTMSHVVFPDWSSTGVSLFAENGTASLENFVAYDVQAERDWENPGIVNSGGEVYSTYDGTTFRYDQFYDSGAAFSVSDTITRTREDRIYQTERVGDPLTNSRSTTTTAA